MSIIQQKLTSGTLKAFWDCRALTVADLTGVNGDGTFTGTPAFQKNKGILLNGVDQYFTSGDIDITGAITIAALVNPNTFNHTGGGNFPRIVDKSGSYGLFVNSTGIVSFFQNGPSDETTASLTAVKLGEDTLIAGTFSTSSGERKVFLNGIKNNEETGITGTIDQNATAVVLGDNDAHNRKWNGGISAIAIFQEELTELEVAQLTDEMKNYEWPQKAFSKARTDVTPPASLGAITAWNMQPINGNVTDIVGGNDGIVGVGLYYNRSILGDSMVFPGATGAVIRVPDATDVEAGTGDFTLGYWVKTTATGSIMRIMDKRGADFGAAGAGYTVGMSATGTTIGGIGDGTTSISDETVLHAGVINDGLWHLVLCEFDRDGNARAFVDNTAGAATSIATITDTLNNVADLYIGQQSYAAAEAFDGELTSPMIFKKTLSITEKNFLFDLGAKAIPFKTDWGVKQSVANVTSGQIENSVFIRNTGTWQIAINEIKEDAVKVLKCISSGVAYADMLVGGQNATQSAYGTWEFWLYKGADANASFVQFVSTEIGAIDATGQDGYYAEFDATEAFVLGVTSNGTPTEIYKTAAGYLTNDQWYKIKITRTFNGVFTFSLDEVDLPASGAVGTNPVTNTDVTEGRYFNADLDTDDMISYSDIKGDHTINTTQTISTGGAST